MTNSLSIDNCLIQVRSCLQDQGIKLWLEPYYTEGIGPVDAELEVRQSISSNCEIRTSASMRHSLLFCVEFSNTNIANTEYSIQLLLIVHQ